MDLSQRHLVDLIPVGSPYRGNGAQMVYCVIGIWGSCRPCTTFILTRGDNAFVGSPNPKVYDSETRDPKMDVAGETKEPFYVLLCKA